MKKTIVAVLALLFAGCGFGQPAAWFYMTACGTPLHHHLSCMEVFMNENGTWQFWEIYASVQPE